MFVCVDMSATLSRWHNMETGNGKWKWKLKTECDLLSADWRITGFSFLQFSLPPVLIVLCLVIE